MLPGRINRRKGASKREAQRIGALFLFLFPNSGVAFAREIHRNGENKIGQGWVYLKRKQTVRVNGSRCRLDGGLADGKGSNTNHQRKQENQKDLLHEWNWAYKASDQARDNRSKNQRKKEPQRQDGKG